MAWGVRTMRRRQRRSWLLLAGGSLLLLLMVACFSHVALLAGEHPSQTARDGGRSGKAAAKRVARSKSLRSRQDLLPVTVTELETLKQLPLQRWDDRQRTLLNMTFRPWALTATDSSCRRMATRFSAGLRPTALVSLPSSGNTWLRQLIEGATGVFTGSLYSDVVLIREGMYGEIVPYDSGTTIAQKTHGFTTLEGVTAEPEQQRRVFSHVTQFGCRAVLLVRNPLAALLSHRHLDAAGHLGFAPPSHFEGEGWQEYVSEKALFWRKLYADWIGQCPTDQLLLVRYERLLEDLPTELGRVLRFLGVRPDPARLRCLYSYPNGRMKRRDRKKKPEAQPAEPFTEQQKALVRGHVTDLDRLVREKGLGELPEYLL